MFPRIQWTARRKVLAAMLVLAALALAFCNPLRWRTPNMTPLTPRLQALFDNNTETVCFGRFLIDVPKETQVAWGRAEIPLGVYVYPDAANKLTSIIEKKEAELKAKERYPAGEGLVRYDRTVLGPRDGQVTIVSYESFDSPDRQLDSYFPLDGYLFQMYGLAFSEKIPPRIAELQEFSQRLRVRAPDEIPPDAGVCIDHAFREDRPDLVNKYEKVEHVRVGFRMPGDFKDVHLSIYVAPVHRYIAGGDSLKRQLKESRADPSKSALLARLKVFRESERTIGEWTTGYESLSRSPRSDTETSYHTFWMKFGGAPEGDPLRPFADILMQSGMKDDEVGGAEPSLTDDEAIALWDKLTSSIRVRPTSGTVPKKTGDAGSLAPGGPVHAATGQLCPATGEWECSDHGNVQRRHIRIDQAMPKGEFPAPRSAWQKLRGDAPTYAVNAVWTLVCPDKHIGGKDASGFSATGVGA